jgi:hypothetical protein
MQENFEPANHYMELADGTRCNNLAIGRGDASIFMTDTNGESHKILLKNALCIPSYKQNILSVSAAVRNGISVNFRANSAELVTQDGTVFNMEIKSSLYFLNSICDRKISCHNIGEWHKIMGHCNMKDILKASRCC